MNEKIDKIVMSLALLATLAAVGVYVYSNVIFERKKVIEEEEFVKLQEESKEVEVLENLHIKKMIINLQSNNKRLRYVEVSVHLIPFKRKMIETMNKNLPIIKNSFIEVASKYSPEELNSVYGKITFENRVKKSINTSLKKKIVKRIFFSKFVIQ